MKLTKLVSEDKEVLDIYNQNKIMQTFKEA